MNYFPGSGLGAGYSLLNPLGRAFATLAAYIPNVFLEPVRKDLTIWRGATFLLESFAQRKVYNYVPNADVTLADRKRTHEENLEFYGFNYEYVNFLSAYASAELVIIRPWVRDGHVAEPILTLTTTDDDIEFTPTLVVTTLTAAATSALTFDCGSYQLLLTKWNGQVDLLSYGEVTVRGDK